MVDVYLSGKYIGYVDNALEFIDQIKAERRLGRISKQVNIYYDEDYNQVFIETSKGRVLRPLIVVKDGKPLLTERHLQQLSKSEISWDDLVSQGIIEYLDPAEEENALVAFYSEDLTPQHNYLEISPLAMVGYVTSLVPFGQHNHGVRMIQGAKNQKQAIGLYAANFHQRLDMDVNILHYPQQPIVKTVMHDVSNYKKHAAGQNIVVAIMAYEGYNIEDAVIMNKASIDRGLARSSYFRQAFAEELRYPGGLTDNIQIPDKDVSGYRSEREYRLLEEDGIIFTEAVVNEGDVVIGKVSPPRFLSSVEEYTLGSTTRRESSVSLKHGESGIIDMITFTETEEGNRLVSVKVRELRIPEIGDKFTSRHGQKGVIGMIYKEEDMPFTASGLKPDLIFSPHSVPSRMTVSHLIELIAGKLGALSGRFVDGTMFDSEKPKDLRKELLNLGFRDDGSEVMYDPITGKRYKTRIFVGDIYYLKLKHLVANKMQARARGPVQLLTRQPTEGKSRQGGLRLGEMEKDTFVAHGASLLLKERFSSDNTILPICTSCGMPAIYDHRKDKLYCPVCGDKSEISFIEVSYAFKLLLDELKSLCMYPRLKLKLKY